MSNGVYTGMAALGRHEITIVKGALRAIGIDIDPYIDKIVEVDGNPRPIGFKFVNKDVKGLLFRVGQLKKDLIPDDKKTLRGAFNAADSDGASFRQPGLGPKLHIEVGVITDCHIDSYQIVADTPGGPVNDFDSLSGHASYDLGPEIPILGYLYRGVGNATFGPWINVKLNKPGQDAVHDPSGRSSSGLEVSGGYGATYRW